MYFGLPTDSIKINSPFLLSREIALAGSKLFPKKADFRFHLGNIYGKMVSVFFS